MLVVYFAALLGYWIPSQQLALSFGQLWQWALGTMLSYLFFSHLLHRRVAYRDLAWNFVAGVLVLALTNGPAQDVLFSVLYGQLFALADQFET